MFVDFTCFGSARDKIQEEKLLELKSHGIKYQVKNWSQRLNTGHSHPKMHLQWNMACSLMHRHTKKRDILCIETTAYL